MAGIPQTREVGWFVTGSDRDPVRHLFVRMEEHMDGSGVWTVELHECRGRRGEAGKVMQRYPAESQARDALDLIYQLSRHLAPLPTWDEQAQEDGRWRVRVYAHTKDNVVITNVSVPPPPSSTSCQPSQYSSAQPDSANTSHPEPYSASPSC